MMLMPYLKNSETRKPTTTMDLYYSSPSLTNFFRIFEDFAGFCLLSDTGFPSSRCRVFHQPRPRWIEFRKHVRFLQTSQGLNPLRIELIGLPKCWKESNWILTKPPSQTIYWSWPNSQSSPFPKLQLPSWCIYFEWLPGYPFRVFTSLPSGRKKGHQALKPCWKSWNSKVLLEISIQKGGCISGYTPAKKQPKTNNHWPPVPSTLPSAIYLGTFGSPYIFRIRNPPFSVHL